jgi:hypothetical protein
MLKDAALDRARHSQFECRGCTTPMKYQMLYSFTMIKVADCCNTLDVAPTIEENSHADAPRERWQIQVIISVPEHCICDPASTVNKRPLKCFYRP